MDKNGRSDNLISFSRVLDGRSRRCIGNLPSMFRFSRPLKLFLFDWSVSKRWNQMNAHVLIVLYQYYYFTVKTEDLAANSSW